MKIFAVLIFLLSSSVAFAHPARTGADGCHKDDSNGDRHCHEGENAKNSAQIAHEQIQEAFDKKPALKSYVSKRGGGKLFNEEPNPEENPAPQSPDELMHHEAKGSSGKSVLGEFIASHPNNDEGPRAIVREVAGNHGSGKVDFNQKIMVFYDKRCKKPGSCIKVPVFTNLKSVMFEYSTRPKE